MKILFGMRETVLDSEYQFFLTAFLKLSYHFIQAGFSARQHRQSLRWIAAASKGAKTEPSPLVGVGEIADVEDVEGIRVTFGEANRPLIEYLVKWKV